MQGGGVRWVRSAVLLCGSAFLSMTAPALAQERITGPVKIIIGFAPGNAADVLARLLADRLADALKVGVIVENKAGAGARIAAEALKGAPADGNTMMISTSSVMLLYPLLFKNMTYNMDTDFQPVAHIGINQIAFSVAANMPYTNLREFAHYVKANPSKAQFGNEGAGSPGHLLGLVFGQISGTPMTFVPYKSTTQLLTDLAGGHVPASSTALPSVYELHKNKQLRIVAIAGPVRSTIAPDIPTFKVRYLRRLLSDQNATGTGRTDEPCTGCRRARTGGTRPPAPDRAGCDWPATPRVRGHP